VATEGIYRANKEQRTIFVHNEFHSMVQGESTISAYYQRLKTKAAVLCDVSHPMQDTQLILSLLRGLKPHFSKTTDDIANLLLFPCSPEPTT
jgi:hypothetical protein